MTNQGESDGLFAEKQGEVLQFLLPNGGTPMSIIASLLFCWLAAVSKPGITS